MIKFTHDCTGDLGITVNGRVVTQYFCSWNAVHDIVAGGEVRVFDNMANALNAMLDIARRELAKQ